MSMCLPHVQVGYLFSFFKEDAKSAPVICAYSICKTRPVPTGSDCGAANRLRPLPGPERDHLPGLQRDFNLNPHQGFKVGCATDLNNCSYLHLSYKDFNKYE